MFYTLYDIKSWRFCDLKNLHYISKRIVHINIHFCYYLFTNVVAIIVDADIWNTTNLAACEVTAAVDVWSVAASAGGESGEQHNMSPNNKRTQREWIMIFVIICVSAVL